MKTTVQQAPIRNAHIIAASVLSHSGEFAPDVTDLRLRGRGVHFTFARFYRSSRAEHIGELGRGWSCGVALRLQRDRDAVTYHNGAGQQYRFSLGKARAYVSPTGFYGALIREKDTCVLRHRFGIR